MLEELKTFEDKTILLTCLCGCGSIRFDYDEEELELCVTPYAIMNHPVIIPEGIWGRIRLAWGVLFGRCPEPTMIIVQDEWLQLSEFLHEIENGLDSKVTNQKENK